MKLRTSLVIVLTIIASAFSAVAQPGMLDPTFGGDGVLNTGLPAGNMRYLRLMEIQADGKVILAAGEGNLSLMRFLPSGAADPGFGTNGVAQIDLPSFMITTAMKVRADGKIVVSGKSDVEESLCRVAQFNADGSPDVGFGTGGQIQLDLNTRSCELIADLRLQTDGKIVVSGDTDNDSEDGTFQDLFVARFNQDGTPDTSFGGDGNTIVHIDYDDSVWSAAIQPDGKIVVAGMSGSFEGNILARFDTDGSLDDSFGDDGKLLIDNKGVIGECAFDVLIQPDGKILVLGKINFDAIGWGMYRLNEDGSLDGSFGNSGVVRTPQEEFGALGAAQLAMQTDGKILVGGSLVSEDSDGYDIGVGRYNADGTVDRAPENFKFGRRFSALGPFWGTNGASRLSFGDHTRSIANGTKIDAAGRVIIYGAYFNVITGATTLALARFQGDTSPYADITGTVRTPGGLPARNVYVALTGGDIVGHRWVLTNQFGLFHFSGLPVTETYTILVGSKRYEFPEPSQTFMLNGNLTDVNFIATQLDW